MRGTVNKQSLQKKGRIYFVIRYGLLIALVVAVIIFASGRKQSSASFDKVKNAVTGLAVSDQMQNAESRYLKKIYGLNAVDYEDVLIYIPTTNMSAQELLLVKLSDVSQSETVVQAIQERIDSQYNIFEGYAPEQVAMLDRAIIDPQGNYILYVSGDNAEKIDEVFRNSL